MNPTFYKITVCQIITLFGNAALRFALPLYLLRRTDSAALYGSVTALALVPMLLGTLAGENTVLVVMKDTARAEAFCQEIREML